jgi:hypothetical protein
MADCHGNRQRDRSREVKNGHPQQQRRLETQVIGVVLLWRWTQALTALLVTAELCVFLCLQAGCRGELRVGGSCEANDVGDLAFACHDSQSSEAREHEPYRRRQGHGLQIQ